MQHYRNFGTGLIQLLRKTKIQYRLLAIFCFISLVPVICLGLYACHVYTRSIRSKLSDSVYQSILSLNQNMFLELEKIQTVATNLARSGEVQEMLHLYSDSDSPHINEDFGYVGQDIRNNIIYSEYLRNVRIINASGTTIYDLGYEIFSQEDFPEILEEVERVTPRQSLSHVRSYRSRDRIVLGSKCYSLGFSDVSSGYILLFIDEPLIYEKVFSDVSFGEGSDIMMLNSYGTVLSAQKKELVGNSFADMPLFADIKEHADRGDTIFYLKEEGNHSMIVFIFNDKYEYYLVAQIPESYITSEVRTINRVLLFLSLLLILLSIGCTMMVYFSIIMPVKNMMDFCRTPVEQMRLSEIHDESPDELGFLSVTMETMLYDLQRAMEQNREDEHRKRRLELQMLQYQINPHFLFNTLNSLQWVAVINDVPVLAQGISSLSTLLKNTLLKEDELITLEEEIDNLKNYFVIQKIRYGNSFDVDYFLESDILQNRLPRLILQPLAENAIVHGGSGFVDVVHITVSGRHRQEGLVIEIRDNGKGYTAVVSDREEDGESKNNKATGRKSSGIGIRNVKERLRLHYGRADLLQIISDEGKGTLCRIIIPAEP